MIITDTYQRPSSIPGPRKEDKLVRFALSNDDLKTNLMPKLSAKWVGGLWGRNTEEYTGEQERRRGRQGQTG